MTGRMFLALVLVLCAIGWWYSPLSPRTPRVAASAPNTTPYCPMPPRVVSGDIPLQTPVPSSLQPFQLGAAILKPLAGFSVDARVLSREDYSSGRESDLSPTDLALGWQRMREDGVLSQIDISQSGRWYHFHWSDQPPLPVDEIVRSSSNMHMIPFDKASAYTLSRVKPGDRVRIDGWLVEVDSPDGWYWRSSLRRDDTGGGACEVVYVCSITRN